MNLSYPSPLQLGWTGKGWRLVFFLPQDGLDGSLL